MLFFKKLTNRLTLDELPAVVPPIKSLRQIAPVLIIDDKDFVYENGLRNSQFNITVHDRWNDIKDVEPYSVIVSDNHGVVRSTNHGDGLTMVNQGRKLYPEKKFALYSGNLLDIRDRDVEGLNIRTKGDSLDVWIEMLDELIRDCYNPRKLWETIRRTLADYDMSEKEIRRMQHFFVLSIIDRECRIPEQNWKLDKDTISLIVRIASLAVSSARLCMIS